MSVAVVTGAGGLVGSESVDAFVRDGFDVVAIENDMRAQFFGPEASTRSTLRRLQERHPHVRFLDLDVRDRDGIEGVFRDLRVDIVVHCAAQPSHDWAASDPHTDFGVNALGTLNLLQAAREHAPDATFVFMSTNKVYGDLPNSLPLEELETRLELAPDHAWFGGVNTTMSIDRSTHSLFGVSKVAADLLVQEYGRYFDMPTVCFRAGCITGPSHAGARLHGFLAYLMRCVATGTPYTVYGYRAKQVRDNIHSSDLVRAFLAFHRAPRPAAVYNIGGGRVSNCSMLEAIELCEEIAGRTLKWTLEDRARVGDHRWWISDLTEFQADYPDFALNYGIEGILREIHAQNAERWESAASPS